MASRDLISALSPPQIFPCTAQTHTVTHTQSPAHTTHSLHTTYVCHIRIHDHITMCACARAHTHIPPPPEGSSSQRFSSQCSSTVCLGNHLPLHAVNHGHCHHHHRHRHHSTNVPHGEEHLRAHTAVPTETSAWNCLLVLKAVQARQVYAWLRAVSVLEPSASAPARTYSDIQTPSSSFSLASWPLPPPLEGSLASLLSVGQCLPGGPGQPQSARQHCPHCEVLQ